MEFSNLPYELKDLIFKFLPPDDLWNCLSVCREWRALAGSERRWRKICLHKRMDVNYFENGDTQHLSLSKYALLWKCNSETHARWRSNTSFLHLIPFDVAEDLTRTRIFVFKKKMALISDKIQMYSFTNKSFTIENIALPFVPLTVTMNNRYIVCTYGNLVLIHKKDKIFQVLCVLVLSEDSTLHVRTDKLKTIIDNEQKFGPYVKTEALVADYLWISCLDSDSQYLHIVNLKNMTIKNTNIVSRLLSVTRQRVIVSTANENDLQIFNFRGDLQFKLNFNCSFQATDDYIVTFSKQGEQVKIWSMNGTYIQTLPGFVLFKLDPTRHLIYSCHMGESGTDCKLAAICLKTGDLVWCTFIRDVKISEIDELFLVCDKFLIIDVYGESPDPNFHFGFVFDLDSRKLLYKAYLRGYTMFVSNHMWVQKRQNDLLVNIY